MLKYLRKMVLLKCRVCRIAKCKLQTWLPIILYVIFIILMLSITFPVGTKDSKTETVTSDSSEEKGELNRIFQGDSSIKDEQIYPAEKSDANVLKFAFRKADSNADKFLTIRELAKYINLKIQDHIDTAIKRNPQIFAEIDKSPVDGLVSWDEYHAYFLKNLNLDDNYINNHDEKKHTKLDRKFKEAIMRDKARWTEVSFSDPSSLTLDDFLAFMHPEASTSNLLNLVEDILRHFDADGDDSLTTDEFTAQYSSSADNKKLFLSDNLQERRAEFKKLIDKNHDGKVC